MLRALLADRAEDGTQEPASARPDGVEYCYVLRCVSAMGRTRSFRWDEQIVRQLADRAVETGQSANALAARYVEEGLRMDDHPQIVFVTRSGGRRPMLVGTRLDVADVVETVLASDNSVEAAAEYLDLPERKVRAAMRYYAVFKDEIDTWRKHSLRLADREEEIWRSEQTLA